MWLSGRVPAPVQTGKKKKKDGSTYNIYNIISDALLYEPYVPINGHGSLASSMTLEREPLPHNPVPAEGELCNC